MSDQSTNQTSNTGDAAAPLQKFVRVLRRDARGTVVFEFAVGWPDMAVELAMPEAAFDAFCAREQVRLLDGEPDSAPLGVDPLPDRG